MLPRRSAFCLCRPNSARNDVRDSGLRFQDLGTKSVSAWANDFGEGQLALAAVDHTIHAIWAPQYIEIQKRSVRWLLQCNPR